MTKKILAQFEEEISRAAPFMSNVVKKAQERFGPEWETSFEDILCHVLSDPERRRKAAKGYVRFALDAIKLQKAFEREGQYKAKTYEEAAKEVYHNEEYMADLYLPGILLSNYLWPHHYEQLQWFDKAFMSHMRNFDEPSFCDVGVGTGFYSLQALLGCSKSTGTAFDISEYSAHHARTMIESYGFTDRWECKLQNVIDNTPDQQWPFLMSVEILEHLEEPVEFIRGLKKMLKPGGLGFITAALTAPNSDHIYLYETMKEVSDQLEEVGFIVRDSAEFLAYEPVAGEPVPRLGAFIVTCE